MARKIPTISHKLAKLDDQRKALLEHRKEEIFNLLQSNNGLHIDDELIVGFIRFASKTENLQNPIMNQFRELAASSRSPQRRKSVPKKVEEDTQPD